MDQSRVVRQAVSLLAGAILCLSANLAMAAEITANMSLIEAIDAVRQQGVRVSYSNRLVKPWMRVRAMPADEDPVVALGEVLAAYALNIEAGVGDSWVIVRGDPVTPVPQSDDTELDTAVAQAEPRVPASIEEVTIISSQYSLFSKDSASGQFLTGDDIRLMPHIADDAFRAFHRLPGVSANDFQASFNLRGGAVDEVKVVLDGLELVEPYHMRSLYSPLSIIDPGIIGHASLLSGGYTADYGNQMSGVLDIVTNRPSDEPVHQLGVSFVNSFARSSGTYASGRGTYQASARRGYLDLLAETVTEAGEELSPRFSDVFLNTTYELSDSAEVSVSVLSATDDVAFVDLDDGEDFGEDSSINYAWVSLSADLGNAVTFNTLLFTGKIETDEDGTANEPPLIVVERSYFREIDASGVQSDLSWSISDNALFRTGARYRRLATDFDYHLDSLRQTDFANGGMPVALQRDFSTTRDGEDYGAYAAFRFQPMDKLIVETGLRWDKQTYLDIDDNSQTSPRVNAFLQLGERTELRAGWGRFYQPQAIQDLPLSDGVTSYFPVQRAEHRVVGVKHLYQSGVELMVDVYDKRYRNPRPRFENVLDSFEYAPESDFDRVRVDPESARSRGVEFTLRRTDTSRFDWWLNYTWSEAEDTIDGTAVPRAWDQRHALTGSMTWRGEKWSLSAMGRYHSGRPRTPLLVLPRFDSGGGLIGIDTDLSLRNSTDFDSYSRVDVRLSRKVSLAKSNLEFYADIYNIFNIENQCCVSGHTVRVNTSVDVTPNFDEFLPFFPSFGFVWTFGPGVAR